MFSSLVSSLKCLFFPVVKKRRRWRLFVGAGGVQIQVFGTLGEIWGTRTGLCSVGCRFRALGTRTAVLSSPSKAASFVLGRRSVTFVTGNRCCLIFIDQLSLG